MRKKRILITGGAGFIGSHLCERFLGQGHEVVAVDNFITGSPENVRHLSGRRNFSLVRHDVSKPLDIEGRVDVLFHFASPASPPDYLKFPIQTMKVGSLGTHNALGLAKKKRASFVLASTSEVYGDPLVNPQPETYWGNVNPIGPRGVYDEAKRFGEALSLAYLREHGVDVKIVRIFNTYGERMRPEDGRVIPNFVSQALRGKPITVYGDGRQTRSYCYVTDLIEGIERLAFSRHHGPVNIGNPNETSVLDLAKLIIKLTGSKSPIVRRPLPVDDPKVRCPDIRLAGKLLGWKPRIGLVEGLERTLPYFRRAVL